MPRLTFRGPAIDDAGAVLRVFEMMDQGATRNAAAWVLARAMTVDPFQQKAVASRLVKKVAKLQKAKAAAQ